MRKKYNESNDKLKLHFWILGCLILLTLFLSIGYASLESITLDIDGKVTAKPYSEIYISEVKYNTSVNADVQNSIIKQYYQTMMQSTVVLSKEPNSSITYNITIMNVSNEAYNFKNVEYIGEFYDNPNIIYELEGLKQGDILAANGQITFSITFHYLNNIVSDNNILNSFLNFKFTKGNSGNTNIETDSRKIMIYNANTDKVEMELTNNDSSAVDLNLVLNNQIITSTSLQPLEKKTIDASVKEILNAVEVGKEYPIIIQQTTPTNISKETAVTVQFFPTITNYDLGLKSAGSEQMPYIIYKVEDFVRLANNVNSGNAFTNTYLKQVNNLNFSNPSDYYNSKDTSFGNLNGINDSNEILTEMTTGTGFMGIGMNGKPFQGNFDGNNNRIENIWINKTTQVADFRTGFFGYINNATIRNTVISGTYNITEDGAGLVGGILGNSNILNCHNYVNITNTLDNLSIAGLIGTIMQNSTVTIDNCSNNGTITNKTATAGLIGLVWTSTVNITNCYNTGTIISNGSGETFSAGLVVKDSSDGSTMIIRNSYNCGEIRGNTNVGGLVARSTGRLDVNSCYNVGYINGKENVGGILGSHKSPYNPKNLGTTTISNSYSAGNISGTTNRGGIVGYNAGSCNISISYYLDNTKTIPNIGNDVADKSYAKSDEYMKSSEFVTSLGNTFTMDVAGINNGYPILNK